MSKATDTLENIATISLPIGQVVGIASNVLEADFPGKAYVGDFIHVGFYSAFSDYIARGIENFGKQRGNRLIQKTGEYFSEITIPLVTAYFVLGETMINWIPGNTMDEKDIYAALIGGGGGFLYAKGMKRRRKSAEYSVD